MAQLLNLIPSAQVSSGVPVPREVLTEGLVESLVDPARRAKKFGTTNPADAVFTLKIDLKARRENPTGVAGVTFNKSTRTSVKAAAKKFNEGYSGAGGSRRGTYHEPAAATDTAVYHIYDLKDGVRVALLLIAGAADAAMAQQYRQRFHEMVAPHAQPTQGSLDLREVWVLTQNIIKAHDSRGNIVPGLEEQVRVAETRLMEILSVFPDSNRGGADEAVTTAKIQSFEHIMEIADKIRQNTDLMQFGNTAATSRSKGSREHLLLSLARLSVEELNSISLYLSEAKNGQLSVKMISGRNYVKPDASGKLVVSTVSKNGQTSPKTIPQSAELDGPFAFPSRDPLASRVLLERLIGEITTLKSQASAQQHKVLNDITAAATNAIAKLNSTPVHHGGLVASARSVRPVSPRASFMMTPTA